MLTIKAKILTAAALFALIAGLLAPLLAPHRSLLALAAALMCIAAVALWSGYRRGVKRDPVLAPPRPMIEEAEQL